jgi:hypothetical protein
VRPQARGAQLRPVAPSERSSRRLRMIAYLLLVHRYPEQFKRLFKAIYDPRNLYLVHVDKNAGPGLDRDLRAFVGSYANAELLEGKKALWGGYSLVDAELRGMERLLQMGPKWTHFINLSGQDFPLKTQSEIMAHLALHPGREFIKISNQRLVRPETMPRVGKYVVELKSRIVRTVIPRRFLHGATPYIGNQWMIVSRGFCEFVCRNIQADRYKAFYRNTFIADEGFFQTVMMNTTAHGEIVNDDLRMIDWVPDGDIKLRPRTYVASDAAALFASPNLFARKFDQTADGDIIGILEGHLAMRQAANLDTPVAAPANAA